ncbi:Uncharacterized protein dnm_016980 [Desulfonema magnum]|uniref:Uncharacterized protein n=1 Tax=Desulfonema magnum TaxID=45655 RepID=A0A975BH80_9BACT|nr:Uncharacterized protein dnm_016980 [Desulfonema magnum]
MGLQTPSCKTLSGISGIRNISDGVANPVRHLRKRFGWGCKPRPAFEETFRTGLQTPSGI